MRECCSSRRSFFRRFIFLIVLPNSDFIAQRLKSPSARTIFLESGSWLRKEAYRDVGERKMTPAATPPVDAGSIVPSRSCYRWANDSVSENVFGPVPRSPCDNSPSLCRWWRSAGVAGSAGAPTPRGSCRGVRRRTREPVPGLRLAAACGRPLLAGS